MSDLMVSSLPSPSPTVSPPTPPTFPGISYSEMSLLQQSRSKVQNLPQSSALKIVPVSVFCSKLLCDVSIGVLRPLVPEPMRRAVFESIHKVSHPGKRASQRLISQSFVWEFLSRDVNLWAQSCISCQQSKVQTHVKTPVHHIPVPGSRFSHIHVDLVGSLPQSCGFSYLFTIIHRSTRWPEATGLWRGSTDSLRFPSVLDLLGLIGFTTFLWFYSDSGAFPEKIRQFPPLQLFLVLCWFFLVSS